MNYSRALKPTICFLVSVAAAQTPAPRPAVAWDVDVPRPAKAAPSVWDADRSSPKPAKAPLFAADDDRSTPKPAKAPRHVWDDDPIPSAPAKAAPSAWDADQSSPKPAKAARFVEDGDQSAPKPAKAPRHVWDDDPIPPAPAAKPARAPRIAWDTPAPAPPLALYAPQVGVPPAPPAPPAVPEPRPSPVAPPDPPAAPEPAPFPHAVPAPPARPFWVDEDAPEPPQRPEPPQAPQPPAPPRYFRHEPFDFDFHFDFDQKFDLEQKLNDVKVKIDSIDIEAMTEKARAAAQKAAEKAAEINEKARAAAEKAAEFNYERQFELEEKFRDFQVKFNKPDIDEMVSKSMAMAESAAKLGSKFGFAPFPQIVRRDQSDDRLYENGMRALENRRYEEALEDFTQVAARGGSRADGAWHWKAYTLNKLGRRDQALAAIAELRKLHPNSRWLDDSKFLEVEVKQSTGQPIRPESESDEELKLLALNGLMQADPERAFPQLESLLKSAQSPKLRRNAVYVLASSPLPRAQQLLEQIARGSVNPDLQIHAIRRIGDRGERRRTTDGPLLGEVYAGTSEFAVKRAVLNALQNLRDKDRLLQIAKTEQDLQLRYEAIRMYKDAGGSQVDLWQLFQAETSPDAKRQILEMIPSQGNTDKLVELARTEKDNDLRRRAIQKLGNERAMASGDALVGVYTSEADQNVKREIVQTLGNQRNVKALIAIARAEKDYQMQRRILERLVNMKSPEATEYLLEILKK